MCTCACLCEWGVKGCLMCMRLHSCLSTPVSVCLSPPVPTPISPLPNLQTTALHEQVQVMTDPKSYAEGEEAFWCVGRGKYHTRAQGWIDGRRCTCMRV